MGLGNQAQPRAGNWSAIFICKMKILSVFIDEQVVLALLDSALINARKMGKIETMNQIEEAIQRIGDFRKEDIKTVVC